MRPTAAARSAAVFAQNISALARTQPSIVGAMRSDIPDIRPVHARDGSLTAFGPDGKWWHGCSVPLRASETMLAKLDVKGRVACLLAPTLAAHVRVALLHSRPDQAVIAVCPELNDLRVLLRCDDFSREIEAHQLWIAPGRNWVDELRRLFSERPGLATPSQFIRLPTTPADEVDRLVSAAQAVFAEANGPRGEAVARRRDGWRPPAEAHRRVCVIAPSQFRLGHDAGSVLADKLRAWTHQFEPVRVVSFDPDDPARSSVLALLEAVEPCDAVVAADTSRNDLPGVVPPTMPWLKWVTCTAAIPPFASAGPADALVLADPAWRPIATAAGWPSGRISVGGWPMVDDGPGGDRPPPTVLAVVADTVSVVLPEQLEEFSSHQLLWNHIAAELAADPFAVGDTPAQYLERRMKRFGVAADGLDATLFLERLIVPAYAQAVVRMLLRGALPVRVFGQGWSEIDEFSRCAAGPVTSRAAFEAIRGEAAAVVDVSATADALALHRLGRPVMRPRAAGRTQQELVHAARRALDGGRAEGCATPPISMEQVLSLLPSDGR